jgi:hypothetical protein
MTPTRVRTLVIIAAVCAIVAWLLLRQTYSSLPPLPWTGVPALLLLAVAEAWSGRSLRSRLRGRGKPIPPIAVARMAALARATSLAAAFVGGFAAGFLLYVASSLDKTAYRADAPYPRARSGPPWSWPWPPSTWSTAAVPPHRTSPASRRTAERPPLTCHVAHDEEHRAEDGRRVRDPARRQPSSEST